MAAVAPSGSNGAARKGRASRRSAAARRPAPAPRTTGVHKQLGWVGVRERLWGGYAAEIRIPSSRSRVWIGKFHHALQAALAYDAAMFCFYGENLPKLRRYNFPELARPAIPEDYARAGLTVANVKAIADNHARTFAGFDFNFDFDAPPVIGGPAPAAPAPPPLQVVEAGVADAGAGVGGDGGAAAAGGGPTPTENSHGNDEVYIDAEILSSDEFQFSCNPHGDDPIAFMDIGSVDMDLIFGEMI